MYQFELSDVVTVSEVIVDFFGEETRTETSADGFDVTILDGESCKLHEYINLYSIFNKFLI